MADTERTGGVSGSGFWVWSLRDAKMTAKIAKMTSFETCHLSNLSLTPHLTPEDREEEKATRPALYKGQWVRTPKGKGQVLQVFERQVTVHIADKALPFPPEDVQPIGEAPF